MHALIQVVTQLAQVFATQRQAPHAACVEAFVFMKDGDTSFGPKEHPKSLICRHLLSPRGSKAHTPVL